MPYPHDDAKLKVWETGLSDHIAKDAAPWDEYDTQIQLVTGVYNRHLAGVSSFPTLDWQVVKAICWVESGAVNPAWKTAPMQIGVNGDPGLRELLTSPTGKLILPPEYAKVLTVSNVPVNGNLNIEAGVGYVLKIMAMFGMQADPAAAPAPTPVATPTPAPAPPVPAGVAAHHPVHGQAAHHKLHHAAKPKVHSHLAIVGWRPFTLQWIAKHYNAGDGNYADKLQFSLDLITGKIKPQLAPTPPPKAHKPKHHVPLRLPAKHIHGRA